MNKDMIQNIFIGVLLGGVILLAGGVYFLATQVQTATQGIERVELSVRESMQKMDNAFRCFESGGQYEAGQCECGMDYSLENGSCMGQDGLTKRQLEEIKAEQERLMEANESARATVSVGGLTFDLPTTWTVVSSEQSEARLRVPDPNYQVTIAMSARPVGLVGPDTIEQLDDRNLLATSSEGIKIYRTACAPVLLCVLIPYEGSVVQVAFEMPESNQPVPANLDGVWFPDTTVTEAEMVNILKSVR